MSNKQLNLENTDKVDQLNYESLETKYIKVQFVETLLVYAVLLVLPFLLLLTNEFNYRIPLIIAAECIILIVGLINLFLLPKAYAYKGFAIREHDITYRSGIIFHSVITIPFCKIQQISINQGPIVRMFGLYSISVVNGSQMTAETIIPGLTEKRANEIKALLIKKIQEGK